MEEIIIQRFTQQFIMSLIAMIIPVLLLIQVLRCRHKTHEIKIFIRMCVFNLLLCLAYAARCFLSLSVSWNMITDESPIFVIIYFICNLMIGVLPLALVVHWLLFVDYTLHQSRDIIRRSFGFAQIIFILGVLLSFLCSIPFPETAPLWIFLVLFFINKLRFLLWVVFIPASYVIQYREKKRMTVPQYIVLTPTVVSIILGYIVSILTSYPTDALGFGIGLMFTDYYMFRRLSYIDPETGFFKEKYLPVFSRAAKKQNITEVLSIRFRIKGDSSVWAGLLDSWKPEHCKVIIKKDGEYLVISETLKGPIAERFITLIGEDCQKEGIEMNASVEKMTL